MRSCAAFHRRLRFAAQAGQTTIWTENPSGMRAECDAGVRALKALPPGTPSLQLLAARAANLLAGFAAVLDGLALLVADPARIRSPRRMPLQVPDWLPALINGGRAFVTIGAVEVFWIATEWPNGTLAIAFAAIGVILLAPRAEQAYSSAVNFVAGAAVAAVCAAVILFAVLPKMDSFLGFSLVLALYLVPAGALMARSSQAMFVFFIAMTANFVPLLAPANQMTYDTVQFYNSALAIVARAYVVTMVPEVAGYIVKLPVVDDQFVHKGDLLLEIDPTDYRIAVDLAEAAVQQAQANAQNIKAQITVQQAQVSASQANVDETQAALTFAEQQAARYRDLAEKQAGTVQLEQQTASRTPERAGNPCARRAPNRIAEGTARRRRGECRPGHGAAQSSGGQSAPKFILR
jgi:hypothetical protein